MKQDLFICPRCRTPLERAAGDRLVCPQDGLEFRQVDGIWRFLLPEREAHYSRFIRDYEMVRRAEGRGSASAEYYRALPFRDLSGRRPADWRIRARSFDMLVIRVLTGLQARLGRALKIIDLGAGNGWLSNRLSAQGDRVIAVDLLVNAQDGLGAWKQYEHGFIPVQAEFSQLPIMDHFADVVIFNASFHYSEDYVETLREALRVVSPEGAIVVMDSPVYRQSASGASMVQEREAQFKQQYGFASNSLQSENYLTYARLEQLARELGLTWKFVTPYYGLRWMIRPLLARVLGRREPAQFHVLVGRRM